MTIDWTAIRTAEATVALQLAEERRAMVCTRMQGILALGQARWSVVMDYRATATWAEQVIIDSASDWRRGSENIAFFAWLLGLTDAQVDDLFRAARLIEA